jgi:hypothetical protein
MREGLAEFLERLSVGQSMRSVMPAPVACVIHDAQSVPARRGAGTVAARRRTYGVCVGAVTTSKTTWSTVLDFSPAFLRLIIMTTSNWPGPKLYG